MLFFIAGLAAVPAELLDAARVDGAGAWNRLRHVTLPMLGPTFGFVVPVALLNALTQVDHVVTMTQGGPSDSTNLLLYYIYQQAEQNFDPGLASAATVASVAALLALALIALRVPPTRLAYHAELEHLPTPAGAASGAVVGRAVRLDGGGKPAARATPPIIASLWPARPVRRRQHRRGLAGWQHFPLWYLNTVLAVRRNPPGAVRHRFHGRVRLRPAALSRRAHRIRRFPAAAPAGADAADRAEPRRRSRRSGSTTRLPGIAAHPISPRPSACS